MNIYEVGQMEAIREMVILFFRRDEAALKRLVGEYPCTWRHAMIQVGKNT